MPKKNHNNKCLIRVKGSFKQLACRFCQKALTKSELGLHLYVCEQVPQEIFDYRYFKTPLGGSSVSTGTTCNSSLTNPLLGAFLDK